jgi:hypothetical protein
MAGLQPPEDVTSLGVEGLVVAVDVATRKMLIGRFTTSGAFLIRCTTYI